MFIIFSLSWPGMCAGALPLHQLLHKLARSGSTRPWPPCAACPRPCRRTCIYGTSLSVEGGVMIAPE